MGLRPTPGDENQRCRLRESGDPLSVQWIPAFAGMTRFSGEFPWAFGPPEAMKISAVVPAKAGTHRQSDGFPLSRE